MTSYQKLKNKIRELESIINDKNKELIILSRNEETLRCLEIKCKYKLMDNVEKIIWMGSTTK